MLIPSLFMRRVNRLGSLPETEVSGSIEMDPQLLVPSATVTFFASFAPPRVTVNVRPDLRAVGEITISKTSGSSVGDGSGVGTGVGVEVETGVGIGVGVFVGSIVGVLVGVGVAITPSSPSDSFASSTLEFMM